MGDLTPVPGGPWGVISVKAQDESYETPMAVRLCMQVFFFLKK